MVTQNTNKLLFKLEYHYLNKRFSYTEKELNERWLIYLEIISRIEDISNDNKYLFEIEYKLLDDNNINLVLIDLINREDELYLLLYPYIYVLEEYLDFDEIEVFL